MTNVFTPETINGFQSATKGTAVSHIMEGNGTLIGFMSNSFYAIMAIIFPMVYSIMVGNRMIAEKVDKGNMAGFLYQQQDYRLLFPVLFISYYP